jgi:AcrR family transcriptional regulator
MSSPGLRERKKQKTRWAIQAHAMRLFAQQGYDATTVEQIAEAAEISPSTFFRYFKTKEDVVIQDRYDDMMTAAIMAAPPELGPIAAMRFGFAAIATQIDAAEWRDAHDRAQLTLTHAALRARSIQNLTDTVDAIAVAFAARLDRPADDFRLRALAGACVGSLIECVFRWARSDDVGDMAKLVDEALSVLEDGV